MNTKNMVPHKITKRVRRLALQWVDGKISHAELSRKLQVSANTAYRMLASALAEELRNQ